MTKKKENVALSSVLAGLVLTLGKLIVGIVTGSMGIMSEAAHSALDLGAAALTYFAVRASDEPPDEEHPYGHGKIESISAFIETGLLFLTSAWIIYEAVHRLISGKTEVEVAWYSFAVVIIAIAIDYSRSRALYKVAKETNSQALEADALHFKSDIYSSAVVLAGLVLFLFGITWADSVAAIGVSLFVLHAGYELGKRTFNALVDAAPEGLLPKLKEVAGQVDGVLSVERMRVRAVGADLFVDCSLNVNRGIPLELVDRIIKNVEEKLRSEAPNADVVVHIHPVALESENVIERVHTIVVNHNLRAHNIEAYDSGKNKVINFDLELDENLSLEEAHKNADHLEKALQFEFGKGTDVTIHLDPATPTISASREIGLEQREKIIHLINSVPKHFKNLKEIHNINIQESNSRVTVSLHSVITSSATLAEAHALAHDVEDWIKKEKDLGISKAFCQIEPKKCEKTA
jgi:cation diffusion facilitator family transporter